MDHGSGSFNGCGRGVIGAVVLENVLIRVCI